MDALSIVRPCSMLDVIVRRPIMWMVEVNFADAGRKRLVLAYANLAAL